MGKTISLKLTPSEEEMINQLREQGITPSSILREALKKYVDAVDTIFKQKGYKEVNLVNHFSKENKNQMDRNTYILVNPVNQNQERAVNQEVNQKIFQQEKNLVNQLVNHEDKSDNKFLNLYIDQLNTMIYKLEQESQELKNRDMAESQYTKESYLALQTEYYALVKDSIKRIDDKFDRIMFYLEESRKPVFPFFSVSSKVKDDEQEIKPSVNINAVVKTKKKKNIEKTKKNGFFQMYRM